MSTDAFIPESYEAPASGGGFTKLENGDNKLRILSSPVMLWVCWTDGKVHRLPYTQQKPQKGSGERDSVKHAWGLIVWNYKTSGIEVLELDKQAIISGLVKHSKDTDWGHPKNYDIVISKTGSGIDTEYNLICKPHKQVSDEIIEAFTQTPIDLNKLAVNESPFLQSGGSTQSTTPAEQQKTVTPENWTDGDPVPDGFKVENGKLKKGLPF